jgi:hypothetical protein
MINRRDISLVGFFEKIINGIKLIEEIIEIFLIDKTNNFT